MYDISATDCWKDGRYEIPKKAQNRARSRERLRNNAIEIGAELEKICTRSNRGIKMKKKGKKV